MNSAMIHNIKKKNTLRRKLKKFPTSVNLREKFKHLRATIKKMFRESRTNYVNSICDDQNNKAFWSKSCNVPEKVSIESGRKLLRRNSNCVANLFNNYFTSIFTTDQLLDDVIRRRDECIENNNNKAHGFLLVY